MTNYRRIYTPGATWFFTVNLLDRQNTPLLIENIKYRTLLTEKYKNRTPYEKRNEKTLVAFIPGTVLEIHVQDNQKVKIGEQLLVLEAMKMGNNIIAPFDGIIKKVHVETGQHVKKNAVLIEFE